LQRRIRFQITTGAGGFTFGPGGLGVVSSCMYCEIRNIMPSPKESSPLEVRPGGMALTWIKDARAR